MTYIAAIVVFGCALGQSGTLAYITGETQESWQLAILDVATGETTAIGQGDRDAYPEWSPDGERLVYQSKSPDNVGIRVVNADGSDDTPLRHQYSWNFRPRWSPDGTRIVYSAEGDTAPLRAVVVYDLHDQRERIWGGEHRGFESPVWLPTTDLVKALDPDDQAAAEALGLYMLESEAEAHGVVLAVGMVGKPPHMTTEVFILTPSFAVPLLSFLIPDSHRYVKWRPTPDHKGRQIAYESDEGGDREIFVLGRRGIVNISNHPAADWHPVWSPDNSWLAFESFRAGRRGIYRALVSTANVAPVHAGERYDCWSPAWSPDGNWLAFVSDMSGAAQLHLCRPDGEDMRQVTSGPAMALSPTWRPTPRK